MQNPPTWSRRGFLSARGLGASSGGLLAAAMPEKEPRPQRPLPDSLQHWCVSRRAMACEFTVQLPPTTHNPVAVAEAALDEIDRLEELLTVYREDSHLSYVNARAGSRPVRLDHRLTELLQRAAELTRLTGGAFDVTAGRLIRAWGFFKGPRRVPGERERAAALAATGMQHVELDPREGTVRYRVSGLEINLGSIGKGYAIDRALRLLREEFDIRCSLMQGGRSSVAAMGSPAADGAGWLVGIQNPLRPESRLAAVRLRNRALGTSGDANQYFEVDGRRYGHVLDPRTGWPAPTDLASASVIAPTGADADALATALVVMGLDNAACFCHNHREIGALLVRRPEPGADPGEPPRAEAFNLPPEDVILEPGRLDPAESMTPVQT